MPISLHDDLKLKGWHTSIITTYSVDPSFYGGYISRCLRRVDCNNNLLLADANMLTMALQAMPESFRDAGQKFAVVPVHIRGGCFHPKVHLRLGRDKARMMVASANATSAGWGRNLEVLGLLEWDRRNDGSGTAPVARIIRRCFDYLQNWIGPAAGEAIAYKRDFIARESPWLEEIEPGSGSIELSDGSRVDLLCDAGGARSSIMSRLGAKIEGERVKSVTVISPYWDAGLGGLRALRKLAGSAPLVVALNPKKHAFPVSVLRKSDGIQLVHLRHSHGKRFVHAKLIVVETSKADHILYGSPNCSDDALGTTSSRSNNAEAALYRRLKRGTIWNVLQLGLDEKLAPKDLKPPRATPTFVTTLPLVPSGTMDLCGLRLTWRPGEVAVPPGTRVRIGLIEIVPALIAQGVWQALLPSAPDPPVVAQVLYPDGRRSEPILVHDELKLRAESPQRIDRRIQQAFDQISAGRANLLELVQYAHMLFADEARKPSRPWKRRKKADHGIARPFDNPEAFRQAIVREVATGESGYMAATDPALRQLLSLMRRGSLADPASTQFEDEEATLLAGDQEDDAPEEEPTSNHDPADREGDGESPTALEEDSAPDEDEEGHFNRLRRRYFKALDTFEKRLQGLGKETTQVSTNLPTQIAFAIHMLTLGSASRFQAGSGPVRRLLIAAPNVAESRNESFAVRTARLMKAVWVGITDAPIVERIAFDTARSTPPDDLFYMTALSRWAIVRAVLEAERYESDKSLQARIGAVATQLVAETNRLCPLDPQREQIIFRDRDDAFGLPAAETSELIARLDALGLARKPSSR